MFKSKLISACAAIAAAMLCGCSGEVPFVRQSMPEISESWTADAEIVFGANKVAAEVSRIEPGCWEFLFTEPSELSGVEMTLENGVLTASLGELSVQAGEGAFTIMPELIAEVIDNLDSADFTENDGILSAKINAGACSCIVTADKATGNILSFKCPSNKLAAYFSDILPYTEEVGLID